MNTLGSYDIILTHLVPIKQNMKTVAGMMPPVAGMVPPVAGMVPPSGLPAYGWHGAACGWNGAACGWSVDADLEVARCQRLGPRVSRSGSQGEAVQRSRKQLIVVDYEVV